MDKRQAHDDRLLNESHLLHNWILHISGTYKEPKKANIGSVKVNIGEEKANIEEGKGNIEEEKGNIGEEKGNIEDAFTAKYR